MNERQDSKNIFDLDGVIYAKIALIIILVIPENFGAEQRNLSGIHCYRLSFLAVNTWLFNNAYFSNGSQIFFLPLSLQKKFWDDNVLAKSKKTS